ncbi:MAG TPA: hypothetical protein VGU20_30005 [Stellaceae bacterium]|nr:hypothetical protein [Stellaceae bacterium]
MDWVIRELKRRGWAEANNSGGAFQVIAARSGKNRRGPRRQDDR